MLRLIFLLGVLGFFPAQGAHAVTPKKFDEALTVFQTSPEFHSTQESLRALEFDYASRDLVMQPRLELEAARINESRQSFGPIFKPRTEAFTASLSKSFSTGTELTLKPKIERVLTASFTPPEQHNFDWQISLSQSLWQDGFGRSTRLRWAREGFERGEELAKILAQRAQLYLDFETAYWEWALALREAELRAKNVRRGQEILRWVSDRYRRSAAESTDLQQARALLINRELQAATVVQNLNLISARMLRYVTSIDWRPDVNELARPRDLQKITAHWDDEELKEPLRIELLGARRAAQVAEIKARETRESIRPRLDFKVTYGKSAIDPDRDLATRRGLEESHEYSSIGLVYSTGLDLGAERKKVESDRAARQSAQEKAAALESEAQLAWKQLSREIENLAQRIRFAEQLVATQNLKANAERERYRKGRSTAFQSIAFEQEAAEAEITLWTLYALMRKTEARARLFAR